MFLRIDSCRSVGFANTDKLLRTQRRAFLYGERLVDRLDFEELALKSLDPSLGPRLSDLVPHGSKTAKTETATPPVVRYLHSPFAHMPIH